MRWSQIYIYISIYISISIYIYKTFVLPLWLVLINMDSNIAMSKMYTTHTHTHSVQTDRHAGQCCFSEIFGEEKRLQASCGPKQRKRVQLHVLSPAVHFGCSASPPQLGDEVTMVTHRVTPTLHHRSHFPNWCTGTGLLWTTNLSKGVSY